jgi:hypothetical protein
MAEANTLAITLNEAEAQELLSVKGGNAGQQQMQAMLSEQLANGNRTLSLNDNQLGKLVRFMASGPAQVQHVLKRAFSRPLIDVIKG